MARLFDDASSQYLQNPSAVPVTAAPITVNCWFYTDDLDSAQTLVSLWNLSDDTSGFRLTMHGTVGTNPVRWQVIDGQQNQADADGTQLNTWTMATGRENPGGTSRDAFINGGNKASEGTTRAPSGINSLTIGSLRRPNPIQYMSGRICQVAIWNVALTDTEIATLYNDGIAISPVTIRPESLVYYAPLFETDGDIDWQGDGTYDLQPFNGPGYAQHVPLITSYPTVYPVIGEAPTDIPISGTSTARADTAGDLDITPTEAISGFSLSVADTAGDLDVTIPISGTSTARADTAGDLDITGPIVISGTSTSLADTAGDIDITPSVAISGVSLSLADTAGDLDRATAISGVSLSRADTAGDFQVGVFTLNPCRVGTLPDEQRSQVNTEC